MNFKKSLLCGMVSVFLGIIPFSFKKNDIKYEIYSSSIVNANEIKNDLMRYYRDNCFSSDYDKIVENITKKYKSFNYKSTFNNNTWTIQDDSNNILMNGYLYKTYTPKIEKGYFFKK